VVSGKNNFRSINIDRARVAPPVGHPRSCQPLEKETFFTTKLRNLLRERKCDVKHSFRQLDNLFESQLESS